MRSIIALWIRVMIRVSMPLRSHRWDVTGDDDLLAEEVEVIEDIEERLLRLSLTDEPWISS